MRYFFYCLISPDSHSKQKNSCQRPGHIQFPDQSISLIIILKHGNHLADINQFFRLWLYFLALIWLLFGCLSLWCLPFQDLTFLLLCRFHCSRLPRLGLLLGFRSPVFLLLLWCKRLVFYLQLHRLLYEDSITEPQNQIITLFETFRCHPRFVIELCQLVCPLFNILCLLKLFQHTDLLFKRCILRF